MSLLNVVIFGAVTAIGLYYLSIYIKGDLCHLQNRIDGKTVLITGANTGIGLETALELARRGGIIHMGCRDSKKCNEARKSILAKSNVDANKVFTHTLDLASIKSILTFTKHFKQAVPKLDILINNAGVFCPYQETEDGFEMQIGVNHLGHFLLTNQLLDSLKQANPSRIIIVSSLGHRHGSINTSDINLRGDDYGRVAAYSQSKLANIIHAKYLAKTLKSQGITVVSLHPGVINTELNRHIPWIQYLHQFAEFLFTYFMKTPFEGAQTSVCCAVDPELHKHSGEYFSDCKPIQPMNAEATNETLAELLWKQSTDLIDSKLKNIRL